MLPQIICEIEQEIENDFLGSDLRAKRDQVMKLLDDYVPILYFDKEEQFFPMSALLYMAASEIWLIPKPSTHKDLVHWVVSLLSKAIGKPTDSVWNITEKDLKRSIPQIQLELDRYMLPDIEPWGEGGKVTPGSINNSRLEEFSQSFSPHHITALIRQKIKRFKAIVYEAGTNSPGFLAMHFSRTLLANEVSNSYVLLPKSTETCAHKRYVDLTGASSLDSAKHSTCYYGRVIDQCGYRILQYWFFYALNNWKGLPLLRGLGYHEGDWEMVTIFGKVNDPSRYKSEDFTPMYLALSSHDNTGENLCREWNRVVCDGTHPKVYVARDSHANYFEPGRNGPIFERKIGPFKCRVFPRDIIKSTAVHPLDPNEWGGRHLLCEDEPEWMLFNGFWGAHFRHNFAKQQPPSGPKGNTNLLSDENLQQLVIIPDRLSWHKPRLWAERPPCLGPKDCDHTVHGWLPAAYEWSTFS